MSSWAGLRNVQLFSNLRLTVFEQISQLTFMRRCSMIAQSLIGYLLSAMFYTLVEINLLDWLSFNSSWSNLASNTGPTRRWAKILRRVFRLNRVFKRLLVVGAMLENRAETRENERSIPRRCQFSNCMGLPKLKNMSCVSHAFVFRSKKRGRSFLFGLC